MPYRNAVNCRTVFWTGVRLEQIRRIAVNTGGGDAPGLNAVIRSIVLSALRRGWEVLGIRKGYEGRLAEPLRKLG